MSVSTSFPGPVLHAGSAARRAIDLARSLPLAPALVRGRGPHVAFLPAGPATDGAVRLRVIAPARELRALGWRTTVLPWKLSLDGRRAALAALRPDILVMQGSRHPLNRPEAYPGQPILYDIDDADFHLPHLADPVARAMDCVAGVIAGSDYVARWCAGAGAPRVRRVWTGAPVSRRRRTDPARRPPVIAWAQTGPETYVREAAFVLEVMTALSRRHPGVRLRLYDRRAGQGEAFLAPFRAAGIAVEWRRRMGYGAYLASFDDVALGFAPLAPETPFSRGKSFGKVLAYLDRKVPVIASDAGDHAGPFRPGSAVITSDPAAWIDAALGLLADGAARVRMAEAGFADFERHLTTACAARAIREELDGLLPGVPA